ncbi:MAG TPA: 5'-methylthioadenosine/S-adenosylhomocysteine nucleosidase [Candidatus Dormibacteraeota bacterium]
MSTTNGKRPVALILALEVEAAAFVGQLAPSTVSSPQLSIWEGMIEGKPVVLVITGVGKVAAALATQFVCDAYKPRCVIALGLAGATDSDAPAGRLIIASGASQHDMDARPFAAARGTIPSLGMAMIPADPALSERLRLATESVVDQAVRSGVILTGDQIVASREIRDRILIDFPYGACFDMETAAIAQVARQNGVPWAALRVTSDAADETFDIEEVVGFGVSTAAGTFERVVVALLKEL